VCHISRVSFPARSYPAVQMFKEWRLELFLCKDERALKTVERARTYICEFGMSDSGWLR